MEKNYAEELAAFIKEHRSNEANFEKLYTRLEEEIKTNGNSQTFQDIREKWAAEYRRKKGTGGTAWPEFEKFVTEFERAVLSLQ